MIRRPLAYVFSGGGAAGAFQVGQLRALAKRSTTPDHPTSLLAAPDLVVGASVGSLNGAMVAALGVDSAADTLVELWEGVGRRVLFGPAHRVPSNLIRHRSLGHPGHFAQFLDERLPAERVEELTIPFAAIATDAASGEVVIIDSGSLRSALQASASVPGLLPTHRHDGRWYIDGGVAANLPVAQAVALGARTVVSFDAIPRLGPRSDPPRGAGALLHWSRLSLLSQAAHHEALTGSTHVVALPPEVPGDLGAFDFSRTRELIDRGEASASRHLDRLATA